MSVAMPDIRTKTNPHVFLLEGEAPKAPGLRAVLCHSCAGFTLGRALVCGYCLSRDLEECAAGQRAKLLEFAISHHPAGGFAAPYAIGLIQTEENLTLFSPLIGAQERWVRGMPLRFILLDRDGDRVAFAYTIDEMVP